MKRIEVAIVPIDEKTFTVRVRTRVVWWFWGPWKEVRLAPARLGQAQPERAWNYSRAAEIAAQAATNGVIPDIDRQGYHSNYCHPIFELDKEKPEA